MGYRPSDASLPFLLVGGRHDSNRAYQYQIHFPALAALGIALPSSSFQSPYPRPLQNPQITACMLPNIRAGAAPLILVKRLPVILHHVHWLGGSSEHQ